MPNNAYDDLLDMWGQRLNVDPQLTKTVFHLESSGGINTGRSLPDDPDSPYGPFQMRPSTAKSLAAGLGMTGPIDLNDMKQAVPLATAYLANALQTTQNPSDALAYYFAGPDTSKWGPKTEAYVEKGEKLYPTMTLTPPQAPPVVTAAAAPPGS